MLYYPGRSRAVDQNGSKVVNAKLYFYRSGTSESIPVYSNAALTVEHTQPVRSNGSGVYPPIYLNPSIAYKSVETTAGDVMLPGGTVDPIQLFSDSLFNQLLAQTLPYAQTQAEEDIDITPSNYLYAPGDIRRYGAVGNGSTDDTLAINTAADVCREGGYTLLLPAITCRVTETLDFSQITVRGTDDSGYANPHIVASTDQFDVIVSYGNSTFENFFVDGGWAGGAGQVGDVFHFDATGQNPSNVAYNIHLRNVRIRRAKRRAVYWYKGGYSSMRSVAINNVGLHAVELTGTPEVQCTTIQIDGKSTLNDAPNGYGLKITEGVSILVNGVIIENTQGINLNSNNNRALTFIDVYQEGTTGTFLSGASSSGVGLTMIGCYGANGIGMENLANWQDVHIFGGSNLVPFAIPLTGRIVDATGDQILSNTTGGVNFTSLSIPLGVGTYEIRGDVQIADGGSLSSSLTLSCKLTTNAADNGPFNFTDNNFSIGAATLEATGRSSRINAFQVFRLTAAATVYLRVYANFAAGTMASKGHLYAKLVQ
jgi:hypothetical protein